MKITSDSIELSPQQSISWQKVRKLRQINEVLSLILTNHKVINLENLSRDEIDRVFKCYNEYVFAIHK